RFCCCLLSRPAPPPQADAKEGCAQQSQARGLWNHGGSINEAGYGCQMCSIPAVSPGRRMLGPRPGERNEQEELAEFLEGVDMVQFVKAELWPPSDQLRPPSKEERERRAAALVDKAFGRTDGRR